VSGMSASDRERVTRREFLKAISLGTAAVGLGLGACRSSAQEKKELVKLVLVRGPGAMTERGPDLQRVKELVDSAMLRLTGAPDIGQAWARYVGPDDVVALHVNGIGQPTLITHPATISAICEGLQQAGVRENNIIIFDRTTSHLVGCGWDINSGEQGIRVLACETAGWDPDAYVTVNGVRAHFTTIVTKLCTKLINVRPLKHHSGTGISLCLKGMAFGMCSGNGGAHHPDHCCPFIATACASHWARDKLVLNIMDGLRPQIHGGPWQAPEYQVNWDAIAVCKDPVALDFAAVSFLEKMRKQAGLPKLWDNPRDNPKHILQAAQKRLGVASWDKIDYQAIEL